MLTGDSVARDSALLLWAKIAGNAGFFVAVLMLARGLGPVRTRDDRVHHRHRARAGACRGPRCR